jgi:hypothetical protein
MNNHSNEVHGFARKWIVFKRYNMRMGWESARTQARMKLHPLPVREYLQRLDRNAIETMRAHYQDAADRGESSEGLKYLNAPRYLPRSTRRAQELNLDRLPPQRILDLGSGVGYFPWVCRNLGHETIGLDTGDVPAYIEMMKLLEIPHVTHRIMPMTLLPDLGARFDLITAFQILFSHYNGSCQNERWSLEEWDFFLHDLSTRLTSQGRIFLRFNRETRDGHIPTELADFFRRRGAKVRRACVIFNTKNAALSG